ncbi:ubiquitin carboxyl-terminal hydrolase 8 [Argentina anserina]|uniref:ubiquitin carboxyl-terminal hydrolase 8 n=1 Tax=Argentina anserina TaxID=57926 RepID=UPI002176652B|nr:ubiquitin carboxyl-terminal hydrolase 8 [Potentilla anserina]
MESSAVLSEDLPDSTPGLDSDSQQRVYFVPYSWWRDAQDSVLADSGSDSDSDWGKKGVLSVASPAASAFGGPMKIINNIFNSDLVFNLRREDEAVQNAGNGEVGVSGRDYALVPGEMWVQALRWHSDPKAAVKDGRSFSAAEDDKTDVYPLQLRLSVPRETNTLGVRITKKDNAVESFKRACKIFSLESDMLRIWDFSGQTNLFFTNDKSKFPKDLQRQSDEILLELQVYGLSDSIKCREGKKDELVLQHSTTGNSCGASVMMNGSTGNTHSSFIRSFWGSSSEAGSLGLTGLQNLGNTCFMNSSIQCLAHTPKLVDYFLGDYAREINQENPLGMDGEIALAFGDLLRKLWAPGASPVAPRTFKSKLARFAPQFNGFNQHDSQELLAFLLDGLHEDLNRVKCKPYVEVKDGDDRPDEEVADEYWRNHLARNDSIIVDVCQGQYKSTLVCPVCKKVSVTFDPFMYLSLPLPSTMMRTMTLTVISTDGSSKPSEYTINVPKHGKFEDLIRALGVACSLGVDETFLVAEIYNNRIIRYLEELADAVSLIRDGDQLVAYRFMKNVEELPLVVFIHQKMEQDMHGSSSWKSFGIPLVSRLCTSATGSDICNQYFKLVKPFQIPGQHSEAHFDISQGAAPTEVTGEEDSSPPVSGGHVDLCYKNGADSILDCEFQFYTADEKCNQTEKKIVMTEVIERKFPKHMYVAVCWPEKYVQQYDMRVLSSLPLIFKPGLFSKKPQETVSLYKCLEAFLKEEPLGPEDMWYCPGCKKHCQASKKLDLWRLPEILVIHLKRFSYSRFLKNKLETYVDFPVDDLDLSTYIAYRTGELSNRYMLYAVSNHYGSMGGGHYTAFVHHGADRWYDFDDSHVSPVNQDKIKSAAAYVLFYRRVVEV